MENSREERRVAVDQNLVEKTRGIYCTIFKYTIELSSLSSATGVHVSAKGNTLCILKALISTMIDIKQVATKDDKKSIMVAFSK